MFLDFLLNYKIAENTKLGQFCQTSQKEIILPYPDANKLTVTVSTPNIRSNHDQKHLFYLG